MECVGYPCFRVVGDAYHLYTRYIYDPISVLAASKVDLLPYQLDDLLHLLDITHQSLGARALIAYETGLGKTILAGLFIKEQVLRSPDTRVLILCPPNVRYQWRAELKEKFDLSMDIDREVRDDALNSRRLIASMDTLKGERWLSRIRELNVRWDVVVVDELHRATEANRRAELIKEVSLRTRHMLGLSATPHDGKEERFIFRLSLIDPKADDRGWREFLKERCFRRRKKDVLDLDGKHIFPQRVHSITHAIEPSEAEKRFYAGVEQYIRGYYRMAEEENNRAVGLVATVVGRVVSSSIHAGVLSLKRRLTRLMEGALQDLDDADTEHILTELEEAAEEGDEGRIEQLHDAILGIVPKERRELLEEERHTIEHLISLGEQVLASGMETKLTKLLEMLDEHLDHGDKVVVFTQYLRTLDMLLSALRERYGEEAIAYVYGGMDPNEKQHQIARLWNEAKILVGTDAAGESLNLQAACVVINYEVPWNPVTYIQRAGRVYRYGQKRDITIRSLLPYFKVERRVLEVILDKIRNIQDDFDVGSVEVIGTIISEKDIEKEIQRIYAKDGDITHIEDKVEEVRPTLERIKDVLDGAEAARRHVRVAQLLSDSPANLVLEDDLRIYFGYLKELGLAEVSSTLEEFYLKGENVKEEDILVSAVPDSLRGQGGLLHRLSMDEPLVRYALAIGMARRARVVLLSPHNDLKGRGSLRLLRVRGGLKEVVNEVPIVLMEDGRALPYEYIRTLKPVSVSQRFEESLLSMLPERAVGLDLARDDPLVKRIMDATKERAESQSLTLMRRYKADEHYYRRLFELENNEYHRTKAEQCRKEAEKMFKRRRHFSAEFSDELASIYVVPPSELTSLLETMGVEDGLALEPEDFDETLWQKKREVELAGMRCVMDVYVERIKDRLRMHGADEIRCVQVDGGFRVSGRASNGVLRGHVMDVSAEGRGYDIEVLMPEGNRSVVFRVEAKAFKHEAGKVTLTENEYRAAMWYKERYHLCIVEHALDAPRLNIIGDPTSKLRFEIDYRPYYVAHIR